MKVSVPEKIFFFYKPSKPDIFVDAGVEVET